MWSRRNAFLHLRLTSCGFGDEKCSKTEEQLGRLKSADVRGPGPEILGSPVKKPESYAGSNLGDIFVA